MPAKLSVGDLVEIQLYNTAEGKRRHKVGSAFMGTILRVEDDHYADRFPATPRGFYVKRPGYGGMWVKIYEIRRRIGRA